ncbi:hypothetical protein FHQ26_00545 [Testudinibacter sp. TR-2022]|uniref:conjugal transfer protein TraG N-terminal domain-containing protein n=1 Tax=Testudinibacter sp. TR-2022 TaxID=2585029 RepID=UPI00111ADDF1|nr:conjugal transfer protein TraG N-terminal domain-containing protein [Testudinibacter sp. TR-2022]TNH04050.1 hypothetical protein FHQ22_05895 [Pasteurellaceae bacterium Phil31]TNH10165.1 hypothetical protein FHQ25_06080 [Testudinibacter sp. TR-2022]TNH13025.1 hypothetical protein FHQ26_00545 [Testudinibacter sp. TR-2022]
MMAFEVTILYGSDIFAQTFNAIATFMKNDGWRTLLYIGETFGVIFCIIKYIQTHDLRTMGIWGLTFIFVTAMLITPTTTVIVRDLAHPGKIRQVDNVPIGVAAPFWFVTNIGNSIAQQYDTFFANPNEFRYSKTGLLFGHRFLDDSLTLKMNSEEFNANIQNYVSNCTMGDIQINNKYSLQQLMQSDNINSLIFANASPVRGIYYKGVGGGDQYMTCKEAAKVLQKSLDAEVKNPQSSTLRRLANKYLLGNDGRTVNYAALPATVNTIYERLIGSSKSAVETLKQNLLVSSVRRSFSGYASMMGGSSDLINIASEQSLMKMRLAQLSSYDVASQTLPALHTTLLVFLIGIFPIIATALFIHTLTWPTIKSYLNVLGSLMLWPVMFAIFNQIINTLTYQTLNGQAFSISNMDSMMKNAATVAGTASWIMLSIPFISFKIFTGLGQQIASAGSYLGNALMSATNADASSVAVGNHSFGNMQMENINGFKHDTNRTFLEGKSTTQTASGGTITSNLDGSQTVVANQSNLALGINFAKSISSAMADSVQNVKRDMDQFSKGMRDSLSRVHESAGALNDALRKGNSFDAVFSDDFIQKIGDIYNGTDSYNNSGVANQGGKISNQANTTSSDSAVIDAGLGVKIPGTGIGIGAKASHELRDSNQVNVSRDVAGNIAVQVAANLNHNKSAEEIKNLTDQQIEKIGNSKDKALLFDLRDSLRTTSDSFNSYTNLQSMEQNLSKMATLTESQQVSLNENYTSEFVQWSYQKYGSNSHTDEVLSNAYSQEHRQQREAWAQEFIQHKVNDIKSNYANNTNVLSSSNTIGGSNNKLDNYNSELLKEHEKSILDLKERANKNGIIEPKNLDSRQTVNDINEQRLNLEKEFDKRHQKGVQQVNETDKFTGEQFKKNW